MSRYRTTDANGKSYSYGFDKPLGEYFLQTDDAELVGCLSSKNGTGANVLQMVEELGLNIPDDHKNAMALDLPF